MFRVKEDKTKDISGHSQDFIQKPPPTICTGKKASDQLPIQ